jgi:hypothetical protein
MDDAPVANHGEDEQQKRNQQQAGSFRGIDRVATALVGGAALALMRVNHASNCTLRRNPRVA